MVSGREEGRKGGRKVVSGRVGREEGRKGGRKVVSGRVGREEGRKGGRKVVSGRVGRGREKGRERSKKVFIVVLVGLHSVPPQDETIGPDPFYDLEQHALLGVANISLECLFHDIEFVYDAPIVAPTGKVCVPCPPSLPPFPPLSLHTSLQSSVP